MSYCNKCSSYNCHCHKHSHHNHCNDCDECKDQVKGFCVFYQGENLDCLDLTKGDTFDDAMVKLNDIVCDLVPPSGIFTTLSTCNSNIQLTLTTPSGIPNYKVCLNPTVTDQIESNTDRIEDLETCVEDGVLDITSSTLEITVTESSECGRTINLEIPAPSGLTTYDGIIYNDTDKSTYVNTVGDKIVKTFTWDYIGNNNLTENDEIRWRAVGQVFGDTTEVDGVKLQLFDTNSATVLWEETYTGWSLSTKQSWIANGNLAVISNTSGLLNVEFLSNNIQNGSKSTLTNPSQLVIGADISAIDFTGLAIRVIYIHNSTTSPTDNFARQLMVEVRKYIS